MVSWRGFALHVHHSHMTTHIGVCKVGEQAIDLLDVGKTRIDLRQILQGVARLSKEELEKLRKNQRGEHS